MPRSPEPVLGRRYQGEFLDDHVPPLARPGASQSVVPPAL